MLRSIAQKPVGITLKCRQIIESRRFFSDYKFHI